MQMLTERRFTHTTPPSSKPAWLMSLTYQTQTISHSHVICNISLKVQSKDKISLLFHPKTQVKNDEIKIYTIEEWENGIYDFRIYSNNFILHKSSLYYYFFKYHECLHFTHLICTIFPGFLFIHFFFHSTYFNNTELSHIAVHVFSVLWHV